MAVKMGRLWWFRNVEPKSDADRFKQCTMMEIVGTRQRGHPRKPYWDCVRGDMESFGLALDDAQEGDQWRPRIRGESANTDVREKWLLDVVCVCLSVGTV